MNSTVQKMNSLIPVATNVVKNSTMKASNSLFGNAPSNAPRMNNGVKGGWNTPLVWFVGFLIIFLALFGFYYTTFMNSIQAWTDSLRIWMTGRGMPDDPKSNETPTAPPVAPQDDDARKPSGVVAAVEKMLPPAKEIFTVSKNDYSFYDAAPLCKALGAELATYDEVKHAWQKGADWCNYGWVKGQMAVYPTQNSTYEELQQGPEEQKGACGKPGVNGGYFDNPELKFGVTCVGKRPAQKQHDVNAISANSTTPLTASGLEFEKKVLRFKEGSDSIGVLPFNKEHWGS